MFISVDIEFSGPKPGIYSMLSLGACVWACQRQTSTRNSDPSDDDSSPKPRSQQTFFGSAKGAGRDPEDGMTDFKNGFSAISGLRIGIRRLQCQLRLVLRESGFHNSSAKSFWLQSARHQVVLHGTVWQFVGRDKIKPDVRIVSLAPRIPITLG